MRHFFTLLLIFFGAVLGSQVGAQSASDLEGIVWKPVPEAATAIDQALANSKANAIQFPTDSQGGQVSVRVEPLVVTPDPAIRTTIFNSVKSQLAQLDNVPEALLVGYEAAVSDLSATNGSDDHFEAICLYQFQQLIAIMRQ